MSKAPIRGWLEPKPPMKQLNGKPVAYVAAHQSTNGLTRGKSQHHDTGFKNYCKPVSEPPLKPATPTLPAQSYKMPHVRPQQYNSCQQNSYVPKPQVHKTQGLKPTTQNKVVQNKMRNNVHVQVNNFIIQDISHLSLNVPKPANVNKKPTTSQPASRPKPSPPKTTSDQKYTRRRPNNNNNGCVINVTNNFINRK